MIGTTFNFHDGAYADCPTCRVIDKLRLARRVALEESCDHRTANYLSTLIEGLGPDHDEVLR